MTTPTSASSLDLPRLIRRLELVLRDLRTYSKAHDAAMADKGVLGSRGLTEFVIDQLKQGYWSKKVEMPIVFGDLHEPTPFVLTVAQLLGRAELAYYSIPTARTLSKRLTERAYRVGDIAWDAGAKGWYWKGQA